MSNQKVPQLPILSAVTGEDLFYVVDVSDTTDDPTGTSKQITRDEILQNITGLTATTISATTYQNLPVDPNYYTTAFTYSNNVFTISQSGQSDLTATINSVTGWTVNGDLTVTGNTSLQGVTATTISATTISATTYYGSGTNLTGVVKGSGTANYLPRWTGTTSLGDSIIQDNGTTVGVGATLSADAKIYVSATGAFPFGAVINNQSSLSGSIGLRVISESSLGTSKTGVQSITTAHPTTGTSISVQGYATNGLLGIGVYGQVGIGEGGSMTTGIGGYFNARGDGEYGYPTTSYGLQVIDDTEGLNKVLISATADGKTNWSSNLTGLTSVSATSISATTYYNLPVDPNYYTTAFTYSNNVFTIRQSGQSDLTATINSVTGWTVNGNLTVTGNTSVQSISANTVYSISATTGTSVANLAIQSDGKIIKGGGNAIVENYYYSVSNSVDTTFYDDDKVTLKWDETGNDLKFTMKVAPGGSGDMRSLGVLMGSNTTFNVAIVSTNVEYDLYSAGISAGNRMEAFVTAENDGTYPAYHITAYNTGESFHNTIWVQKIIKI